MSGIEPVIGDALVDERFVEEGLVVVGVDGSATSRAALVWAAKEAARRRAELDVVCAWLPEPTVSPAGVPGPPDDLRPFEAAARQLLDDAVAWLPGDLLDAVPGLHCVPVEARAAAAVVSASIGADLLVVGSRGRGPVTGLLGSVSHQAAHHAACPVAVVPPGWPDDRPVERIVVGVDGSTTSTDALWWALEEAARWDARLSIVHGWHTPFPVEPYGVVVTPRDQERYTRGAHRLIEAMLEAADRAGVAMPRAVEQVVADDAAGPALVKAAVEHDVLVVGSRGRGGFAALLLGSVALQCLHHAPCPVVVVKHRPH